MIFRPCIDLHEGKVKQIVGGSLNNSTTTVNFTSDKDSSWFAEKYKKDSLFGGHVIMLGNGNSEQVEKALSTWPDALQVGGGVSIENAQKWINKGASHVILTSSLFSGTEIDLQKLKKLHNEIGKDHIVIDLSCRKKEGSYFVVKDRWQTYTNFQISHKNLDILSAYCSEFLIHGVDVEGLCLGIETPLVELLGTWDGIPITYAGGIRNIEDIKKIKTLGNNKIDFTVGSALDIFGGSSIDYDELIKLNKNNFKDI